MPPRINQLAEVDATVRHGFVERFVVLRKYAWRAREFVDRGINLRAHLLKIVDGAGPYGERSVDCPRNLGACALDNDLIERATGLKTKRVRIAPGIAKRFEIESTQKHSGAKGIEVADVGARGSVRLLHDPVDDLSERLEVRPANGENLNIVACAELLVGAGR